MKTIQDIQKDWAKSFDTVKLSSGEIVEGKGSIRDLHRGRQDSLSSAGNDPQRFHKR